MVGEEVDRCGSCKKVTPMAEGEVDDVQLEVSDSVGVGWVPQVGVEGDRGELVGGGVELEEHRATPCAGGVGLVDVWDEGVVVVVFDVVLQGVVFGGKFGGPGDGCLLAFVGAVDGGDELVEWREVELDLG